MADYSAADATEVLLRAKNLNSAVKKFLKKEVEKGDNAARFAKKLKHLALDGKGPSIEKIEEFISASLPKYETHLLAIGGYAYSEEVGPLIDEIMETYAEKFNTTYTLDGEDLKVNDKDLFNELSAKAVSRVKDKVSELGFKGNTFLIRVALVLIFEDKVLEQIAV